MNFSEIIRMLCERGLEQIKSEQGNLMQDAEK